MTGPAWAGRPDADRQGAEAVEGGCGHALTPEPEVCGLRPGQACPDCHKLDAHADANGLGPAAARGRPPAAVNCTRTRQSALGPTAPSRTAPVSKRSPCTRQSPARAGISRCCGINTALSKFFGIHSHQCRTVRCGCAVKSQRSVDSIRFFAANVQAACFVPSVTVPTLATAFSGRSGSEAPPQWNVSIRPATGLPTPQDDK